VEDWAPLPFIQLSLTVSNTAGDLLMRSVL